MWARVCPLNVLWARVCAPHGARAPRGGLTGRGLARGSFREVHHTTYLVDEYLKMRPVRMTSTAASMPSWGMDMGLLKSLTKLSGFSTPAAAMASTSVDVHSATL